MSDTKAQDDERWRSELSPEEYRICRQKGTEAAFTGAYLENKAEGKYLCKCCGEELFDSSTKFDSGSGWPSFYQSLNGTCIEEKDDSSHAMHRTEITCSRCGCHLGHVFPDGPQPSGLRYCVNSASLSFSGAEDKGL